MLEIIGFHSIFCVHHQGPRRASPPHQREATPTHINLSSSMLSYSFYCYMLFSLVGIIRIPPIPRTYAFPPRFQGLTPPPPFSFGCYSKPLFGGADSGCSRGWRPLYRGTIILPSPDHPPPSPAFVRSPLAHPVPLWVPTPRSQDGRRLAIPDLSPPPHNCHSSSCPGAATPHFSQQTGMRSRVPCAV